jgi:ferredoxin-NADP reductase
VTPTLGDRLSWKIATLTAFRDENPTSRTLVFKVPGWPGHLPGQHVDVRLTAADGYRTQRSYSMSTPENGEQVQLTVQRVPDGEVSSYLTETFEVGYPVEFRGPIGGWFVWRAVETQPVPLMAMIRARRAAGSRTPFRLIYSVRTPEDRYYADELRRPEPGLDVTYGYTRATPEGWPTQPKRLGVAEINNSGWPPDFEPSCFVCGPTGFVETVADILVALGHDPHRIKTERFGPS